MSTILSKMIDQENLKVNLNLDDEVDEPLDLGDFFSLYKKALRKTKTPHPPRPKPPKPLTEAQFQKMVARNQVILTGHEEIDGCIVLLKAVVDANGVKLAESYLEDGEVQYRTT